MDFSTTSAQLKCIKYKISSNLADFKYTSLVQLQGIYIKYVNMYL